MKKSLQILMISTGLLICTLTGYAQPANYAPIPYSTGFETGVLDMYWFTQTTLPTGRVQPWNSTTFSYGSSSSSTYLTAHTGTYWLGLDTDGSGTYPYSTNQAWLGLDLSGITGSLQLSFWYSETAEEPHSDDGVFISDNGGITFFKIADPNTTNYTQWSYYSINLDSAIAYHSLTKSATFVIKFQEYDNWPFPVNTTVADGVMYDDIDISQPLSAIDEENFQEKVQVYPNPAMDLVNISLSNFNGNTTYTLMSATGQIMESGAIHSNFMRLDLSSYSNGFYLLHLNNDSHNEAIKLFKQ